MRLRKFLYTVALMAFGFALNAQTSISGQVIDAESGEGLIGATVFLTGTERGTLTDFDGNYILEDVAPGTYNMVISYTGYASISQEVSVKNTPVELGLQKLGFDAVGLKEISVVASIATNRRTPVAVSTISQEQVQAKLGNQEFPEILKNTPSIYATKGSGGYGDARINVRGFAQEDIALLINGIPVNGIEDNKIYWSNWAGLGDVTRTIQVQRGLGASRLAVASVGGTINILTKSTDMEKGGSVQSMIGNDGYKKFGFTVSTGKTKDDWALTFSGSRTTADGYVEGTYLDAWNYFFSLSKDWGDHQLMLTGFGAPQKHGQRDFQHNIGEFRNNRGIKWNDDFGTYQGEDGHIRENFYHKPQVGLNHIWNVNDKTDVVSTLYGSYGRGGGTGDIGGLVRSSDGAYREREFRQARDVNGHFQFDQVRLYNMGMPNMLYDTAMTPMMYELANGDSGTGQIAANGQNGLIKRASMNEHQWFGFLSNVTTELTENLTFNGGIDLRWYTGSHYRKSIDLWGADYWFDDDSVNATDDWADLNRNGVKDEGEMGNLVRPKNDAEASLFGSVDDDQKIDYHNEEDINWYGTYGQVEYSTGGLSAFLSGAINYTQMRRRDFFQKTPDNNTTDWISFIGGNVKLGANYNIDARNNVFVNVGHISRAPYFDALHPTFSNDFRNDDAVNEKVYALELGYGFKGSNIKANLNGYLTQWEDKTEVVTTRASDGTQYILNLLGVNATHSGVEFDFKYNPIQKLGFIGFASLNNWEWTNNPEGQAFDDAQNPVGDQTKYYLNGLKVGDAAQTTLGIGADLTILPGVNIDAALNFYENLYGAYDPEDRDDPDLEDAQALLLPSYELVDLGVTWKFDFGPYDSQLRVNVNNLFDKEYIAEANDRIDTTIANDRNAAGYTDLLNSTRGWFGFGRTWNASWKINF